MTSRPVGQEGHCYLQTCRPFFAPHRYIYINEVNFSNRLLWVIEDQSHQKWVIKKKRLGTAEL